MSKRAFTEEEKELLSNNKFVKHVGDRGITYTKEYKIHFLNEKKQGKSAYEIFEGAGFDTELLGFKRITSFDSRVTRDGVEDRRPGNSGRPRLTEKQIALRLEKKEKEKEKKRLQRLKKLERARIKREKEKAKLLEKKKKQRQRQLEKLKKQVEAKKKREILKKLKKKSTIKKDKSKKTI